MKKRGKKAVSPVVSTVLLIGIVVILAVIIFLWARSFEKEAIEKEIAGVTKTADKFCLELNFKASVSNNQLFIVNNGNIPIYEINVKKISAGTSIIKEYNVDLGASSISDPIELTDVGLGSDYSDYEVIIIPVLLGKSGDKKKKYTCPESVGVYLE